MPSLASTGIGLNDANRGMTAPPNYQVQRQLQFAQQQLAVARYRSQNQRTLQDQQSLMAIRQQRAERTRQFRADRIARAKAQRESKRIQSTGDSSAVALVSTVTN
ncbi:MAG: hypothetical protein ACR2NZ_05085 [Rubripirellula sp.]